MHFMDDHFVNLGEEVILTLLWQSGASESATVCFVISLSICYWLLRVWVSEREREIERERERERHITASCVCVREMERERERHITASCVCVWAHVCERGETLSHNRRLCANTYEHRHGVCHATLFPSRAWTDGKTKDIINCLYFYLES